MYRVSRVIAVQKGVRFFVTVWSSSLFYKKKTFDLKLLISLKNTKKINCFKTNESQKNADTLLIRLLFTKSQRETNIKKSFFVNAGAQKRWKSVGSGNTLPQYLPIPNNEFSVKFIFTWSVFVLPSTDKKAKSISF